MSGTHNPKDKFKTLCYVVADISAVPPTSISVCSGAMRYHYEFDAVLLMGLTELKAQLRWIDYSTVCHHESFWLHCIF